MHKLVLLRLKLSVYLFLFVFIIRAQDIISIGNKLSIHSKILNQDREIWVSLPRSYNDTIYTKKKYPVCYFFDGDSHFENLVAQTNRLSKGLYAAIPEMILVGIIQKDRTNELTPTKMETPREWKRANFSTSGGNEKFMNFIENELKTYVSKKYRTNDHNILIGHSFGGLAVINTFFNKPTMFNAYVAVDPSMWWDNKKLLNSIDGLKKSKLSNKKTLFLAKADDVGPGSDHHDAILKLHDKLTNLPKNTTNYKCTFYKGENHGSVVVPAEYDAIRFIFDGFELPVKNAMKNPELIDEHYNAISKKVGYTIIPDEKLIDDLAKVCIRQELFKQAEYLLYKNTKLYPNSERAQQELQFFLKQ